MECYVAISNNGVEENLMRQKNVHSTAEGGGVTKLRVEVSIFMKNAHIFIYKVACVAVNIVETVCTYTFTVVIWLLAVR